MNITRMLRWSYALLLWTLPALAAERSLSVASPFGDHMVLQRQKPVQIWGNASAGAKVLVRFGAQAKDAPVDAAGRWRLALDPMEASAESRDLTIESDGAVPLVIHDVLVGEVWLGSGQSNMCLEVRECLQPEIELATADLPAFRYAHVPDHGSTQVLDRAAIKWQAVTPKNAGNFSAVGFFFGRQLHRRLQVPVGFILCGVGGTDAEQWVSASVLAKDPAWNKVMLRQLDEARHNERTQSNFQKDLAVWRQTYGCDEPGDTAADWGRDTLDTADWTSLTGRIDFSRTLKTPGGGIFWLRRELDLPPERTGKAFQLSLGNLQHQILQVYWNGRFLGTLGDAPPRYFQNTEVSLRVGGDFVKSGRNVLAIRSTNVMPGITWEPPVSLTGSAPVAGEKNLWLLKAEKLFPAISPEALAALPQTSGLQLKYVSTALYNGMLHPLIPYTFRGVIWYQGEANVGRADRYQELLTALIGDWRSRWAMGDFPFYLVQLANWAETESQPVATHVASRSDSVARLREAQMSVARSVPQTAMAVAIDVGERWIHPRNKQDVADRLARMALSQTYGIAGVAYQSPLYASMVRENQTIRLHFTACPGGLMVGSKEGLEAVREIPDGKLQQFAICGPDRKFLWAEARIDGDSVVVSSPAVSDPVAVRYAWSKNPQGCNLYGKNGLPAAPFRTDSWPIAAP